MSLFEDRGKEVNFDIAINAEALIYQSRIIWVNSHYIPFEKGCLTLLIVGYCNNKVILFSIAFDPPLTNVSNSSFTHTNPIISLISSY